MEGESRSKGEGDMGREINETGESRRRNEEYEGEDGEEQGEEEAEAGVQGGELSPGCQR